MHCSSPRDLPSLMDRKRESSTQSQMPRLSPIQSSPHLDFDCTYPWSGQYLKLFSAYGSCKWVRFCSRATIQIGDLGSLTCESWWYLYPSTIDKFMTIDFTLKVSLCQIMVVTFCCTRLWDSVEFVPVFGCTTSFVIVKCRGRRRSHSYCTAKFVVAGYCLHCSVGNLVAPRFVWGLFFLLHFVWGSGLEGGGRHWGFLLMTLC